MLAGIGYVVAGYGFEGPLTVAFSLYIVWRGRVRVGWSYGSVGFTGGFGERAFVCQTGMIQGEYRCRCCCWL